MPHDRGFLDAEFVEQRLHVGCDHIKAVGEYWLRAFAITNAIHCDHPKSLFGKRIDRRSVGFGVKVHPVLYKHSLAVSASAWRNVHVGVAKILLEAVYLEELNRIGIGDLLEIS